MFPFFPPPLRLGLVEFQQAPLVLSFRFDQSVVKLFVFDSLSQFFVDLIGE